MENLENGNLCDLAADEVAANEEKLRHYIKLLSAANELARLTGPSDPEILWNEHLLDCAAALPLLPDEGKVIDVGTGGGLPGIVWAICRPRLTVTLLDSITRKCALVEKMAVALGLNNVTVVCARSEDYAKDNREKFRVAAARAVCASGILAEYLAPLIKTKGRIIAFKGPRVIDEIEEVGNKWGTLGLSSPKLTPYMLGDIKRYFLTWEKTGATPKGIPRRPGMAEKFPWYTMKK
ncbi:MAG: 16S rRNA (guanine(527)-N(7))-methyltransferase RsmG [Synergistaceae bacterium]|nr:16S rRNA (guanine(527)-N(7))-methyltransferase RsmG [Synergistaceae bacterium]